ncbi:MAG: hypothetical protein R2698_12145 [Microthrixaceae bacterium]
MWDLIDRVDRTGRPVGGEPVSLDGGDPLTRRMEDCIVLSVDQSSSSRRIDSLGDDAAFREQRSLWALIESVCTKWGGHVCGWRGDGALARFGEAASAVEAALAIVGGAAGLPRPVGTSPAVLRAGISRGPALLDQDGHVFGVTLLSAVRLCAIAPGASIVVTDSMAHTPRIGHRYRLRSVGRVALKGIREPVGAWDLRRRR